MLFNILKNDLDDVIESTFTKSADDTKPGGEKNTSEGWAILQRNLGRLDEWESEKNMKFNRDKWKILHLGQNNWRAQHKIASLWLGSSLAEGGLKVLMDNMLNMSQQGSSQGKSDPGLHLQGNY